MDEETGTVTIGGNERRYRIGFESGCIFDCDCEHDPCGKCFKGITLTVELGSLPEGVSLAEILSDMPSDRALSDIAAERRRQIEGEGWTREHDDQWRRGEIAGAAACYAMQVTLDGIGQRQLADTVKHTILELWPWASHWWKPTTARRDLVKAAALILAEIERLDRMEAQDG